MSGYKTMIQTLFTKDVQKDFYAELNELAKMSRFNKGASRNDN